ncbi:winged helix-turn-helix domain-containing protein [Streptomyces sp. H27-C3]|uniref:winged helix-turn-helix domain-containing protein n=1 Tax=Streptomyces sp. H27-C3 TaxID=3046305 RepID=UPI0024BB12B4|nr:winged helix-turn-helix domain-containing protein [Streptomyces sp. H27-C3]MDJ0466892.1 winged helix-turn-helix domain-containing protein [Streptomyces sp. H27-C3]
MRVSLPDGHYALHRSVAAYLRRQDVSIDARPVRLAPKEFAVLRLLMEAGGSHVPHHVLIRRVWGKDTNPRTSAAHVTIYRLRNKPGDLHTTDADDGRGYRLR